jgi:hypothetical protein
MKLHNIILVTLFLLSSAGFAQFEKPCDSAKEKDFEAHAKKCALQKFKSKSYWKTLPSAQKEILELLDNRNYNILDYVGCDSGDSSQADRVCDYYQRVPGRPDLMKIFAVLDRSPGTVLKGGKWHQYGVAHDIFVYCSPDYKFTAAQNYCDDKGKSQPVVELRQTADSVYVYGFPLSGVPK